MSADYPVFVNKQNGIVILWLFKGNCNLRNLFAFKFSEVKSDFLLKFVVFLIIFIKIRRNYNRPFLRLCVGGFNSELFKEFFSSPSLSTREYSPVLSLTAVSGNREFIATVTAVHIIAAVTDSTAAKITVF